MKKSLFLSALAATMLLATSCQEDALLNTNPGEKATVTFSLATPQIATRAYSDGTTAQELQYAVYDANGNYLDKLTGAKEINLKTQVQLQLTTGNKYTLVFWADAATAPYTVDFANKKMTIDYSGVKSNREDLDAFYRDTTFVVTGNMNVDIELYRPFAQLNIGTDDLEATAKAGYPVTTASVKVKTYNTFNLIDETVDGFAEVNFAEEVLPTEAFPVTGYEYIAMNYLLMTEDKSVVDEVVLSYGAEPKTRTFKAIPLQRNYRTNIYGQMFTSDVDVNVEIIPTYNEPAYTILDAFENGGVATLTEDILLNQPLVVKNGVKAVLELNGKTIKNQAANALTDVILVEEGAELTINGDGVVEAVSGNDGYAVIANGKLTINGGTFRSGIDQNSESNAVIYARGNGEVYINGGTFEKSEGDAGFVVNKKDGDRATTTIEIRGGMFKGFNPANNAAEGAGTNFVADGYSSIDNGDGTYTVVYGTAVNDATELASALANNNGGTIILSNANYGAVTAGVLKDVTIEGDGNAIMIFKTDANTKIENVTINNVKFEYTGATADCGIVIDANAQVDNLVIEGCSFVGTGAKAGRGLSGFNNSASITFSNCTFKDLGYPIYAWGGYESLTIKGCTFDNIISWAIMPQSGFDGDLTVTGCNFIDLKGGLIKAGKLTAGHTFTFTNNTITNSTEHPNRNWFEFTVSNGTSVISGNTMDGVAWTPTAAEGLK